MVLEVLTTSILSHTNFAPNKLFFTFPATSPTRSNYPSTHAFSCRRLSSTDTDVVALEVKPPQTAVNIGLNAFSQGLAVVVA